MPGLLASLLEAIQNAGLAYGSGVVVAKDKVITNCHVLRKTKSPWVSYGDSSFPVTGVQADQVA